MVMSPRNRTGTRGEAVASSVQPSIGRTGPPARLRPRDALASDGVREPVSAPPRGRMKVRCPCTRIQPHPRTGTSMAFRLLTPLALAFLGAGCGGDDVRSPTAPTPSTPSAPVVQGFDIVNARDELFVGYTVALKARLTYSNGGERIVLAEWTSSAPALASVDPEGLLEAHAAGVVTITARAEGRSATATVAIRPPGPDDTFWRQFAFNDDCRTRFACQGARFAYRPLDHRRLWRLPTPSPDFFIVADSLSPAIVDRIHETIPRAVPQFTGVPYTGRIHTWSPDMPPNAGTWIMVEGGRPRYQEELTTSACRTIGLRATECGRAYIGREHGCIALNMHVPSCLSPSVIMHEIGHALGFYHTPNAGDDIMYRNARAGARASPLEQHHGRFAYTQRRGARYPNITLGEVGPRRPRFVPSPLDHGGIAVD